MKRVTGSVLDLPSFKKKFDAYLISFVAQKIARSKEITSNTLVSGMLNHVSDIVSGGGKRIRPYCAYLGYVSSGGVMNKKIFEAFVGIELFHVFALIHDDVMDRASHRHGIRTVHTFVNDTFSDSLHDAYSEAILAGDLVYTWAHEALLLSVPLKERERVQTIFYEMIEEVTIGQMIDIDVGMRTMVSFEEIEEKNKLKTARYTCVHPFLIGSALAPGYNPKKRKIYEAIGLCTGSAFQIQDDLMDIVGDPKKTGKNNFCDIEESKHTHFTNHVFKEGDRDSKKFLQSCFGKKLSADKRKKLFHIFEESGAIAHGTSLIDQKISDARILVENASFSKPTQEAFLSLLDLLAVRKS